MLCPQWDSIKVTVPPDHRKKMLMSVAVDICQPLPSDRVHAWIMPTILQCVWLWIVPGIKFYYQWFFCWSLLCYKKYLGYLPNIYVVPSMVQYQRHCTTRTPKKVL